MASREVQKANVKRGAAMGTMRALVVFSTVLCPQLGASQPAGVATERGLPSRIMLKSMPLRGVLQPLPPAPQAGSPATQIRDYLAHWNKDPKPFVWTAATTLIKVQLVKAVSRSSSTTTPNNDTRITRR